MNWPWAVVICVCAICATLCIAGIFGNRQRNVKRDDDINY